MAVHAEDPENDETDKVLWILARFVFLLAELGVLALSICIGHLGHSGVRNLILGAAVIAAVYSSIQAYVEFNSPYYGNTVMRSGFEMYGQGGPLFCLLSSLLYICLYLGVFFLPFWPCRPVAILPQPLLFYSYVSFHLVLNIVTTIGTILLLASQSAGMCITNVTSFVYFSCLPGLAFLCFVRPWLRVSQPNLLMSYTTTEGGEEGEEATMPQRGSVHSLMELPEPTIIKQQAGFVNTPIYSSGILSPDSAEEGFLISTS
jgi:hypothetical protein